MGNLKFRKDLSTNKTTEAYKVAHKVKLTFTNEIWCMKYFLSLAKALQYTNAQDINNFAELTEKKVMLVNGMWGLTEEKNHFGVVVLSELMNHRVNFIKVLLYSTW
jgi:hypothetical protein